MSTDFKPMIVETYERSNSNFEYYTDLCKKFYLNIEDEHLIKNYLPENLFINEWVAVSVYLSNCKNLMGFSSIAHRPRFKSGVRLLNRFVKHPGYRFVNSKLKLSNETRTMIEQQISVAKELGFQYAFISRDSSYHVLKHYLKSMNCITWFHEVDKYKVCDGPLACCQLISWTPLMQNVKIDMEKCND